MEPASRTAPADTGRIGLFGGTFDPPHRGHVGAARDVADALGLERVLWIPCGTPPHKRLEVVAPAGVRVEMARAAAAADPRFEVSTIEIERDGPSFTVDTVRSLARSLPGRELVLIIGVDQFAELETWSRPEELLGMVTLAVMDREGVGGASEIPPVAGAQDAVFVRVRRIDVSSTDVRARVASGEEITDDVPPGVAEIVARERLYRR